MQSNGRAEATAAFLHNDASLDDALAPDAKLAVLTVPDSIVREALRLKEMGVQMKSGEMRLSEEEVSRLKSSSDAALVRSWIKEKKDIVVKLQLVEGISSALCDSVRTLEVVIRQQIVDVSFAQGIALLPAELLLRIFSFAGCQKNMSRRDIALVCRRFRDLVYSHPSFWGNISNNMDTELIDLYLARSKNAKLTITTFYIEEGPHNSLDFLRRIIDLCSRWAVFRLVAHKLPHDGAVMTQTSEILSGLSLPALNVLQLSFPQPDWYDYMEVPHGAAMRFYQSWDAPALRGFLCDNFVLCFNPSFKLTRLSFGRADQFGQMAWDPRHLAQFLEQQPTLQKLDIQVPFQRAWEEDLGLSNTVVRLESLREVRVDVRGSDTLVASQVMQEFSAPALEKLVFHVDWGDDPVTAMNDSETAMDDLFPPGRDFPSVKSVSLHLSHLMRGLEQHSARFEAICRQRCPSLQSLTIDTVHLPIEMFAIDEEYVPRPRYIEVQFVD